jgi:pSer/pThr/pTyr-binding forkhead associated (FHA) protein
MLGAVAVAAPPAAVGRTVALARLVNRVPTGLVLALPETDYEGDLTVGRLDLAGGVVVDVDLSAHEGRERGVSRRHALLRYAGGLVTCEDAGSAHGTWVNGQRLEAGRGEPLADGDELRLAELVFRVEIR